MASSRLERIGTILTRVEGLINKNVMKPDDRPIWFDVYKRFPPLLEPKFARPKPKPTPLRQIFYKEDIVRAKLHAKGLGIGGVNMLNTEGETTTRKLLQQYKKLESEGVPEDQIIEKCALLIESDRKRLSVTQVDTQKQPSVSQQVLSEANIREIFKDN